METVLADPISKSKTLILTAGPSSDVRTVRQRIEKIAGECGLSIEEALDMEFLCFLALYQSVRRRK